MRLPFLRPKADPGATRSPAPFTSDEPGAVQQARTRARRRLVGALVLLVVGVVSFPLLFETQPRPMPGDVVISAREGAGAQPGPARGNRPLAPLPVLPADAGNEGPGAATATAGGRVGAVGTVTEGSGATAEPAAQREATAAAPPASPTPALPPAPAPMPQATATPQPTAPAAAATRPSAQASTEAATAKPSAATPPAVAGTTPAPTAAGTTAARPPTAAASTASPASARFAVQVGAFAEERALREARQKAEKLGLKTYIQVIDAEGAKRTRVRVGPFETREQAEATAKKLKAGGLPAAILTL